MNSELKEKMQKAARAAAGNPLHNSYSPALSNAFRQGATAMYAELAPLVEWVSVKDRLPKHAQKVLVKTQSGYVEGGYFEYATFRRNDNTLMYEVTHWRKIEL
jgi:hypothetical protein